MWRIAFLVPFLLPHARLAGQLVTIKQLQPERFEALVLVNEPERRPGVTEAQYDYSMMILEQVRSATERDPDRFNVADYLNVLSAFLTLQEPERTWRMAFDRMVAADTGCGYLRAFADKAFLKTERDENDLNHFLHYAIKNLRMAFEKLTRYRDRKREERRRASALAFDLLDKGLNKRQADLMAFLSYRDPASITLKEYAEKHDVIRQTASKDLGELVRPGLLGLDRSGIPYRYTLTDRKAIDAFLGR
jgi:DNA-binding MarR family transcriptional regulator